MSRMVVNEPFPGLWHNLMAEVADYIDKTERVDSGIGEDSPVSRSRIYQHILEERERELAAIEGEKKEIGWGSQIRSYVLQPYQMVKDLRTDVETSNVQSVLNGDITFFMEAYLRSQMGQTRPAKTK